MRRRWVLVAAVAAVVVLVLELLAVPVARRVLADVASRCVGYESLDLVGVDRPVLPRLLLGRATGVEVAASGVTVGELRIDEAHLALSEAVLPWAPGESDPSTGILELRLLEPDLQHAIRTVLPLDLPIELDLEPGVAVFGAPLLPVTVDLEVEVEPDGDVILRPRTGAELLDRYDIEQRFPPSPEARVTRLTIADGEVTAAVTLAVVPEVGGGEACEEPLAGG